MLYLSQLLNMQVEDSNDRRVGRLIDILLPATLVGQRGAVYPDALLIEGEEERRVPLSQIEQHENALRLRASLEQFPLQSTAHTEQEVRLAQEVLDKQVIDIKHKKALRVNDVCFADDWRILGIDNSNFGLVRRLAPAWLLGGRKRDSSASLIPWERIELIGSGQAEEPGTATLPYTTRIQSGHLSELHPADIAAIVHQLTPGQGAYIIEGLDDETAADTMEEIDTERQSHILENIRPDRAADILEEMEPDKAADLIAQLPEEQAQELLRLMTPAESEDVQELLEYERDTAGGLMTTDYLVLNQSRTVAEALEAVRLNIQENDVRSSYIYCVADETQDECRVLGEVSLWDLLVAAPGQILQDLMETDVITVPPEASSRAVAETMAKYNLLAVPVVNTNGTLEGIVTVDDALDVLLPPDQRRKPRRMY